MGRLFIILGILFLAVGIWITLGWPVPFRLGRLPGDIYVRGRNTTFYFPIVTCIVLSVILTLVMSLLRR